MTKKRKKRIRKLPINIVLFIIAVVVTFATPTFNIVEITVEGNKKYETEYLKSMSGIPLNKNIWLANTDWAERSIEKIVGIDSADVKRVWPDKIKITVAESQPYLYVKTDKGYIALNKNARAFKLTEADFKPESPVIIGAETKNIAVGKTVKFEECKKLETAYKLLAQFESEIETKNIKEMNVSSLADVFFETKAGLIVKLGSLDNLDYKIQYFGRLLSEIGEDKGGLLNMTNPDKATYRESIY